jgi:hypothetical protein
MKAIRLHLVPVTSSLCALASEITVRVKKSAHLQSARSLRSSLFKTRIYAAVREPTCVKAGVALAMLVQSLYEGILEEVTAPRR